MLGQIKMASECFAHRVGAPFNPESQTRQVWVEAWRNGRRAKHLEAYSSSTSSVLPNASPLPYPT